MDARTRVLCAVFTLTLGSLLVLPVPADARGSYRRNYAEEWEQEEREDDYREEREREREEWMEQQSEENERYYKHQERQLDKTMDRIGLPDPNAVPPRKSGGTCIYGEGNTILYQPAGAVCDRK